MEKKRPVLWLAKRCGLALAIGSLAYLLFGIIGANCLFRQITGLPCLTCGMSRAWLCALSGNLGEAFFWHPLFWAVPLIALLLIFAGAGQRWVQKSLLFCLILFAAVYLTRMILLFPHTAPMTADPNGLVPRLAKWHF